MAEYVHYMKQGVVIIHKNTSDSYLVRCSRIRMSITMM